MDLKAAVAAAKRQVAELCAPAIPGNMRLENFLYDDHLGVWSLTIGFTLPQPEADGSGGQPARRCKIVRISEASQSVLSVADR